MHIQKINNNKLEIVINSKDLKDKNITIHDFMSSSTYQKMFISSIIEYINKKIDFNFNNGEIILESFSIPSIQSFIITITKIPYRINNKKYKRLKLVLCVLAKFNDFNSLCAFCNAIDFKVISNLFYYNGFYYLSFRIKKISHFFKILLYLKEFDKDYKCNSFLDENAKLIIKNHAIDKCKYFYIN